MPTKPHNAKKPQEESKRTIILLDTHAILHRAFHALPDFTTKEGKPTGALYGLSTMLLRLIDQFHPEYIFACYDLPEKTFRHEAYDGYKGKRQKTDDALIDQIIESEKIFKAFDIPIYSKPGFEADDMLGTLSEILKKDKKNKIVVASGDMDTLQLVSGTQVVVYTLKKGISDTVIYDEKSVTERFGFSPKFLPDYKGLRGDPSDNIVGIKGIGEKTAETLIKEFHTIEKMYSALKKTPGKFKELGITPRIQTLLQENEEEALFSKVLATIRKDAPIDFALPEKKFSAGINEEKALSLFKEFEFRSLINRFAKTSTSTVFQENIFDEEKKEEEVDTETKLLRLLIGPGGETLQKEKLLEQVKKDNLTFVWENIEKPLFPIVKKMEAHGILLDTEYLQKMSETYHKELNILEKKIYEVSHKTFNINSPKQLSEVLFTDLGLVPEGKKRIKKNASGGQSTDVNQLEKLRGTHPIIEYIFEYREIQKLLSTYVDVLPGLIHTDGRVHATFNQMGAITGRFSSENPNLQNIPIKSERGRAIRNAFIAPQGYKIVSADYSQIELRVAALLSQDVYLLTVFQEGKDIHAAVSSRVFGVPEDKVTPEMRRQAKVINFGILYGMGVTALAQNLGSDRKTAQDFYDAYFAEFPTIRAFLDGILAEAKKKGYTETLFGRRRYFKELRSHLPFMRAQAERMAVNAPLQGTAADIIKLAIIAIEKRIEREKIEGMYLISQVHDELLFEVKNEMIDLAEKIIKEEMESVISKEFLKGKTAVPLSVSIGRGPSWGEAK